MTDKSTGAAAVLRNGRIEISIDVDALPAIVFGSCCDDGLDGLWKVTDAAAFAAEVFHALNNESETGATMVHRMFDGAFQEAIEQGAEGIEEVDDEEFEAEAAAMRASIKK